MTQTRKVTLIGGTALVGMLVAGWMLVLAPRGEAIAATDDKITAAVSANDALRSQIAARRAQEEKLPELRTVSKALDGRFPPSAEQPELYRMVTAAAGRAGIAPGEVTNLTVNPPVAGTGAATSAQLPGVAAASAPIATQQITMDVKGGAAEIRKMVANLEELPRAFGVTTVSLSTPAADPKAETDVLESATATITGQMFVMPALKDPTLAASKAKAKAAKAPAAAAATAGAGS